MSFKKRTTKISFLSLISDILSSRNVGLIKYIIKLLIPVVLSLFESSEEQQDNFLLDPLLACASASDTSVKKSNNTTFCLICFNTLDLLSPSG